VAVLLAVAVLALFLLGEALLIARSDSGQIALGHFPGLGDHNRITQIVSKHLRRGLAALHVPDDSVRMGVAERGRTRVVWRIGLPPEASLLRTNYVLTRSVEQNGARVLSGRERAGGDGETIVELMIGLPGRPTHQVELVRRRYGEGEQPARSSLLAVVLYGFGDDQELASEFMAIQAPFAMALAPGEKANSPLIKAAHDRRREIVLQLPLEPINYPQVNPGPGTLLVTMPPSRIAGLTRKYIHQAKPLIAVSNLMGSLATQDMAVMTAVFRELRGAGVPFVHVSPAAGAVCKDLAADLGVAYNEPAAMIDAEARQASTAALDKRWSQIIEEASGREKMVVWVRATPLTLRWLEPALKRRMPAGVHVVGPSFVIRRPLVL
jgi:polysaccharide deacetylase 2 family uncharacterized protein YibQ